MSSKLYSKRVPLTASSLPRIYAQSAYPIVRELQSVPIVAFEALALSAFFPLAWRKIDDGFEFVALRSLGKGKPPTSEIALPLLLRAFPFRNDGDDWTEFTPAVDGLAADQTEDVGSPIFIGSATFAPASLQRIRALMLYARNFDINREMSEALAELQLLVPWDLKTRAAEAKDLEDDLYVAKDPTTAEGTSEFLARFRQKGAGLLAAHRLSMYRTQSLLQREPRKAVV